MTEREQKLSNLLNDVKNKRDTIVNNFQGFTDGVRLLLLLERKKDGGHNKEETRVSFSKVTLNEKDFEKGLLEALTLQATIYTNHRLYLSVNSRDRDKVIHNIEEDLLFSHYSGSQEQVDGIRNKLLKKPRHWLMQPKNSTTSYFILDIDDEEGRDIEGEALKKIEELGVDILLKYRTKNGWHIVTKPFNPSLWDSSLGEIKKDGLMLISYV